jgi:hypothetical protein
MISYLLSFYFLHSCLFSSLSLFFSLFLLIPTLDNLFVALFYWWFLLILLHICSYVFFSFLAVVFLPYFYLSLCFSIVLSFSSLLFSLKCYRNSVCHLFCVRVCKTLFGCDVFLTTCKDLVKFCLPKHSRVKKI